MNTYEVVLACPFCDKELFLDNVQADSLLDAKDKAVIRWPDARESEMVIRSVKSVEREHRIDAVA